MLRFGIGALLIILICTIVLSYYRNAEGFDAVAGTTDTTGTTGTTGTIGTTNTSGTGTIGDTSSINAIGANDATIAVDKPDPNKQTYKQAHGLSISDPNPSSTAFETSNTQTNYKIDKINLLTNSDRANLYVYASAQLLPNGTAQKYWIITENPSDPNTPYTTISKNVIVTNDTKYRSAIIPLHHYRAYIGQLAYLVPRGSLNPDDAITTFTIPPSSGTTQPTVVNPQVTVSDTGYNAMQLNKKSNLLNDIQKIIHNEMLSQRTLDVNIMNSGKGAASQGASSQGAASQGASSQGAASQGASSTRRSSKQKKMNSSSDSSCGAPSDSCDASSPTDPDMSKYIRKDQIPCYGCSLDY